MQYLESVNTPDYPEADWVINPDLSAVEGVPQGYWVLETIPAIPYQPYQPEILAQAEVLEVLDTDGVTVLTPYSPAIAYQPEILEHMAIPERNIVRPMTLEEKAIVDSAIPIANNPNKLLDGTPAFFDVSRNIKRSINEKEIVFFTKTTGSKNFYLNANGFIASNVLGAQVTHNSVVVSISAQVQVALGFSVIFELKDKVTNGLIASLVLPANSTAAKLDTAITLTEGTELSAYVSSVSLVTNPMLKISLSSTN